MGVDKGDKVKGMADFLVHFFLSIGIAVVFGLLFWCLVAAIWSAWDRWWAGDYKEEIKELEAEVFRLNQKIDSYIGRGCDIETPDTSDTSEVVFREKERANRG